MSEQTTALRSYKMTRARAYLRYRQEAGAVLRLEQYLAEQRAYYAGFDAAWQKAGAAVQREGVTG